MGGRGGEEERPREAGPEEEAGDESETSARDARGERYIQTSVHPIEPCSLPSRPSHNALLPFYLLTHLRGENPRRSFLARLASKCSDSLPCFTFPRVRSRLIARAPESPRAIGRAARSRPEKNRARCQVSRRRAAHRPSAFPPPPPLATPFGRASLRVIVPFPPDVAVVRALRPREPCTPPARSRHRPRVRSPLPPRDDSASRPAGFRPRAPRAGRSRRASVARARSAVPRRALSEKEAEEAGGASSEDAPDASASSGGGGSCPPRFRQGRPHRHRGGRRAEGDVPLLHVLHLAPDDGGGARLRLGRRPRRRHRARQPGVPQISEARDRGPRRDARGDPRLARRRREGHRRHREPPRARVRLHDRPQGRRVRVQDERE